MFLPEMVELQSEAIANFWPRVTLAIATPKLEVGRHEISASVMQWLKQYLVSACGYYSLEVMRD